MNKEEVFHQNHPGAIFLDDDKAKEIFSYIRGKGLVSNDEKLVAIEKPGEGNMNFIKRVITTKQSFIVKQSRPWVEKYPQINAPTERIEVESRYYQLIQKESFFHDFSPQVILYDKANLILITEDLGNGSDFTSCYGSIDTLKEEHISELINYLSHLHNFSWNPTSFPSNMKLKQLNHAHIFVLPYLSDNGFNLDSIQPSLEKLATPIKQNAALTRKIKALGDNYLEKGKVLIHGDYYPGSWLNVNHKLKIIDPEFAHFGYPEFDLGVMTAHLLISGISLSDVKIILEDYRKGKEFYEKLFWGFCGTEILRRLIGIAQLPLEMTIDKKRTLIRLAEDLVLAQ